VQSAAENAEEYKRRQATAWPGVLARRPVEFYGPLAGALREAREGEADNCGRGHKRKHRTVKFIF
jgi:hypothetical protein